jgi:hypothetical protein
MKTFYLFLPLLLISIVFAEKAEKRYHHSDRQFNCLNEAHIDINNDIIVLTCKYDNEQWVEITPDYNLYVNGYHVRLNRYQQRLVEEYYDNFMDIIEQAKQLGKEGALIGVKGAKIGIIATAGALKMLVSNYDSDDIEEDLEGETSELEECAEKLEELAEELEEAAEAFEDIHYTMKDEIKDLNELEWF